MKIKHLLIVNLILILLILGNYWSKNSDKKYIFNRNYSPKSIKVIASKKINIENNLYYTAPSEFIALYKRTIEQKNPVLKGKLLGINPQFKEEDIFTYPIHPDLNPIILFLSKDYCLYTDKWRLYLNNTPIAENMRVINAIRYNENEIVLLGESSTGNLGTFGFFILDLKKQQVREVYSLQTDKISNFPKHFLQYEGNFKILNSKVVYINKKSSNGWIIDNEKILEFHTKDNTPLPSVIKYNENYFYERGKTFNANANFYLTKNFICVFSSRIKNKNEIVIDFYNYQGKYLNSKKVEIKDQEAQNIINVFNSNEKVCIAFINKLVLIEQNDS